MTRYGLKVSRNKIYCDPESMGHVLPTSDKNLIGSKSVVVHEMKTRVQDRFVKKIESQDGKCNTDIVLFACNVVKQP